jgi:aminobenzoyl-glutamate utilization protein B
MFIKMAAKFNVIPEELASGYGYVTLKKWCKVTERMNNVAKGAALMAGVTYEIKLNNGLYELLTNETGAKTLQNNMNIVGPITYTLKN